MNLDELRAVQSKERQRDSLQNLRPSFYQEVGEYIADLEAERDQKAAAVDDPFSSPAVGRLTDEIETAKDVVEAIYERRMGKIVKQASLSAAGMAADDDGLTREEADLFDDLVDRIRSNKGRVLDVLAGNQRGSGQPSGDAGSHVGDRESNGAGATPHGRKGASSDAEEHREPDGELTQSARGGPADGASNGGAADGASNEGATAGEAGATSVNAADVMGGDVASADEDDASDESDEAPATERPTDERADSGADAGTVEHGESDERARTGDQVDPKADGDDVVGDGSGDVDRVTVRITRNVGSILGVDDREYALASDDVVTLPAQNAAPLVERDAAELLE